MSSARRNRSSRSGPFSGDPLKGMVSRSMAAAAVRATPSAAVSALSASPTPVNFPYAVNNSVAYLFRGTP